MQIRVSPKKKGGVALQVAKGIAIVPEPAGGLTQSPSDSQEIGLPINQLKSQRRYSIFPIW